ncbi:MAG: low temperature requirement protein A [Acidimicrobiia bacterium]
MATPRDPSQKRFTAVRREGERVTPLELFFDLVFVLALTQCTALMADEPTWAGVGKAMLVLAVLWWAWVGYAWLTSVVDPEEGSVRIAMFAAMAALLVAALCVPGAFGDDALTLAIAIGFVRAAHIALFTLASREDPALRKSVVGLGVSTGIAIGLLVAGSFFDGSAQAALWVLALVVDLGGPAFFGAAGWELVPDHFAERHGLIVIIALGESIVAIGIGAEHGIDGGVIYGAIVAVALAATMWWLYFDAASIMGARRLAAATVGREQNEMARDAYSFLHYPMVAGIVLVALGLKTTLGHVDEPLPTVEAFAFVGGLSIYVLAHVAFAWRTYRGSKPWRLLLALVLLALLPVVREIDAVVSLTIVAAVAAIVVAFETVRYAELRDQIRHEREPEV